MANAADNFPNSASWLSPLALQQPTGPQLAFRRLWHGFMTARILVALVLLLLQASIAMLGPTMPRWLIGLSALYLGTTLAVRLLLRPRPPGPGFDGRWMLTIGLDIAVVSALQFLQIGGFNYTPLFAMPVLLAAVMGSMALALGTAALVTLALLANAWWLSVTQGSDLAGLLLQAGLTGTGLFVVAFLANQLAARLAREEETSHRNRLAARVQLLVNELVIESLTDGVLVIDTDIVVRAANPAARQLLGGERPSSPAPFGLGTDPAWAQLADLAQMTFSTRHPKTVEIVLDPAGPAPRHIHARTRLTAAIGQETPPLCVIFLEDLREMQARLRNEKLAAMGRMSAAVAHEIRNPLAAITQANALLQEDLSDPAQQRLAAMIAQNAQRLAHIVGEILDVARVEHRSAGVSSPALALDAVSATVCHDWIQQNGCATRVQLDLQAPAARVMFDTDHLRRVLINLLDNALRYAGTQSDSIQVSTRATPGGEISLRVWSDGAPLDAGVQSHLFEPFFSSESRSTGLGLYICRELCSRHHAVIGYERNTRQRAQASVAGNEFFVVFQALPATPTAELPPASAGSPTEHARQLTA